MTPATESAMTPEQVEKVREYLQRAPWAVNATGCWVWLGERGGRGYASIRIQGASKAAHRFFYERVNGPVPDGMVIDHLCRNKLCVNPAHLEAVSSRENTLRGIGPSARNALKTSCSRGHSLSGDNIVIRRNRRYCRECDRHYSRLYEREARRRAREAATAESGR